MTPTINSKAVASTSPDKLGIQETGGIRPEDALALTETRHQFRRVSEADPSSHINDPDNPPGASSGMQLQSRQVTSSQMAPGSHQTQQEAAPTGVRGASTNPDKLVIQETRGTHPADALALTETRHQFRRASEAYPSIHVIDPDNPPGASSGMQLQSTPVNSLQMGSVSHQTQEEAWLDGFSPSHQDQQKKIVTEKDHNQLRNWLAQFSNDNELIESVLKKQEDKNFPAMFLFTISQLMRQCTTFEVVETKDLFDDVKLVDSAKFSADGSHMVIVNGGKNVTIAGQGADGSWEKKYTYHHGGDVRSATLSADGRNVVTVSYDSSVINAGQNDDGSWKKESTINFNPDDGIYPISATLSADGCRMVIISCNGREWMATIYDRSDDESWKKETTINDHVICSAIFSADASYVMTVHSNTAKIIGQNNNGLWEEKATFTHPRQVQSAIFSANGQYVVITGRDSEAKILDPNTDESSKEKLIITHDGSIVTSAAFSGDGRHVVTTDLKGAVKITEQSSDGSWKEKATFTHHKWVREATFSADSCYVVTASRDCTAKILGQNDDGYWEEKLIITHNKEVKSASFSPDGCHVVTASHDGKAKIAGRIADGTWKEKATINHGGYVTSATFSADGCYVITRSLDGRLKITPLISGSGSGNDS